jgi:hypothetical protein
MLKKVCLVLFVISVLPGCQKLLDYYNPPGNSNSPDCRLVKITNGNNVDSTSYQITYDSDGYPVAYQTEYFDLSLDYSMDYVFNFEYDDQKRLITQISDWVYSEPEVHYAYEGNSRLPVRDTIIRHVAGLVYVEDLEYDNIGRLVKLTRRVVEQWFEEEEFPDETYRYYYDIRGNRQEDPSNESYNGLIQYSDKPSVYSLHPVWRVMFKNWSKNSIADGKTYNEEGLPAHIAASSDKYENFIGCYPGSSFTYVCQ